MHAIDFTVSSIVCHKEQLKTVVRVAVWLWSGIFALVYL